MLIKLIIRALGIMIVTIASFAVDSNEFSDHHELVDELMVFVDKEDFSDRLRNYHKRLILPAVKEFYADSALSDDPQVIAIAEAQIDEAVRKAVFEAGLIENINREYFSEKLSEQELRAIVEILKLPKGKQILLNFSDYLHKAQARRVTTGRDMRNDIEKNIFDALTDYQNKIPRKRE